MPRTLLHPILAGPALTTILERSEEQSHSLRCWSKHHSALYKLHLCRIISREVRIPLTSVYTETWHYVVLELPEHMVGSPSFSSA